MPLPCCEDQQGLFDGVIAPAAAGSAALGGALQSAALKSSATGPLGKLSGTGPSPGTRNPSGGVRPLEGGWI
jgi:hypothetical protein